MNEHATRNLVCGLLKSLGYSVLHASNGQEGLRVAREHNGPPIRLVISDVGMLQDGGDVDGWLKSASPDLRFIFTSGYMDDTGTHLDEHVAGIAFLPKPYTPAQLAYKIRTVLDQPSAR